MIGIYGARTFGNQLMRKSFSAKKLKDMICVFYFLIQAFRFRYDDGAKMLN